MGVRPAERALQYLVENVEPDVGAYVQTSPDRRLGVLQIDTYAQDRSLTPARLPQDGRVSGSTGTRLGNERSWPASSLRSSRSMPVMISSNRR